MERRVLIIGWDGGTWKVFGPLAAKGVMPRLKSLMDRGSYGVMRSTLPPVTPPAWTTLMTGLRPEKHGIFGFLEGMLFGDSREESRSGARPVSSLSLKHRSILDILGDAGKRIMCINVPMTYPPRPVNGILISDFLSPTDAVDFTYPPELKDELTDYTIDIVHATDLEQTRQQRLAYDKEDWIRRCGEIVTSRAGTVCRLGATHPWDFGIVVFTGTDRIFHSHWPEIMTLAAGDAPAADIDRLLLEFFGRLDEALGMLLDAFGDATVILASDHGFQQRADHTVFPDICLEEKGYLVRRESTSGRRLRQTVRRTVRRAMEVLLPTRLTARLLTRVTDRQTRMAESIDRHRSKAFFAGFDAATYGAVRLVEETTAGLDDEHRSRLIDEITSSLMEMRNPETGETILTKTFRREELFPGAVVDFLPEIILEFRRGYTGRVDPLATELLGPSPKESQIGVHDLDGMFVLAGDIARPAGEVAPLHLADIAPMVLWLLGLPIPKEMQGAAPVGLFTEEYATAHPVEVRDYAVEPRPPGGPSDRAYTAQEEKQVKEHLRRLGYME